MMDELRTKSMQLFIAVGSFYFKATFFYSK